MPIPRPRGVAQQIKLAQTLIRNWEVDDFDFARYEDRYRQVLQELITAKVDGRQIVAPQVEEEAPEVVNLLDALKKSLTRGPAAGARKMRANRKRRSA